MSFELPAATLDRIDELITHYPESRRSAVLMVLHEIQHVHGFLSEAAVHWTAEKLGIQPIQVLEVVTFYPGFRQAPPGRFHFRVCRTLSCAMAGSAELMKTRDGAQAVTEEVKKIRPARPRRRRLPDRREVGLHPARNTKPVYLIATPTNPSPAPSRTATSSTRTRTSCSRA
jgi:hypothetical protein